MYSPGAACVNARLLLPQFCTCVGLQLREKESEVRYLQYQISKAALNANLKDNSMETADAQIKALQVSEHAHENRAQALHGGSLSPS